MEVAITQRCERSGQRARHRARLHAWGDHTEVIRIWRPYGDHRELTSVLGCIESSEPPCLREGDGGVEGEREHEGGVEGERAGEGEGEGEGEDEGEDEGEGAGESAA